MKDHIVLVRNFVIKIFYQGLFKPIFFLIDPEDIHDQMLGVGGFLGRFATTRFLTGLLFDYQNPLLSQSILGIKFKNPVGLAAGFDKEAMLTGILSKVGFGFEEVGSITGKPCPGNPKPRLWRLKKSQSLMVYYGLKNDGCEKISERLKGRVFTIPLGVNVAKTNDETTVDDLTGIEDYVKAYRTFVEAGIGCYFTINISCPNAFGGEPFTEPDRLNKLLQAIKLIPSKKPIFLKMPAELPLATIDEIIQLARKYQIAGFICTNLAKDRSNPKIVDQNIPQNGGMSGKIVQDLSDNLIKYIYKKTHNEFVIVGCGGVFNAEDAYRKIKLGASLIQLITGMIYEGPEVISDINLGLVKLLERDGFTNICQAVGADSRN
jgi:dihydroorotate dehydrogenase